MKTQPWANQACGPDTLRGITRVLDVLRLPLAAVACAMAVAACGHPPAPEARSASGTSSVLAWGASAAGQLGDENAPKDGSDVPVTVKLPVEAKVTAIAVGGHHSLAVTSTGSVLAWGFNGDGELGDGSATHIDVAVHSKLPAGIIHSGVPVKVKLPAGTRVTAVAAGDAHSCSSAADGGYSLALTSTGQVLAWGNNGYASSATGAPPRAKCRSR